MRPAPKIVPLDGLVPVSCTGARSEGNDVIF